MISRDLMSVSILISVAACASLGSLAAPQKRPLDHDDYSRWLSVQDAALSRQGRWLSYALVPDQPGDGTLEVHATGSEAVYSLPRATAAVFDHDERFVVCRVEPEYEAVQLAKKDGEDEPLAGLAILDLDGGEVVTIEGVESFQLPQERGGWVAYRLSDVPSEADDADGESDDEQDDEDENEEGEGAPLVLRELASGAERTFEHVTHYAFSEDGRWVAFASEGGAERPAAVHLVSVAAGANDSAASRKLIEGAREYRALAFDESGERLGFLAAEEPAPSGDGEPASDEEEEDDAPLRWRLHLATTASGRVEQLVGLDDPSLPPGWGVSEHRAPHFSESGSRLFFGCAPLPPEKLDEPREDEEVVVDVWSWHDDLIQPQQLEELEQELERTYLAVVHLDGSARRTVLLANEALPEIEVAAKGEADLALATTDLPYRKMGSWDGQVYRDVVVVDVESGATRRLLERVRGSFALSPGGRYVYGWDLDRQAWIGVDTRDGRTIELDSAIPGAMQNELHDTPSLARAYGAAGWLEGDAAVVLYDRYDLWRVDPKRPSEAHSLTDGAGRAAQMQLRWIDLDPEEEAIPSDRPLLLSAFGVYSKTGGFWQADPDARRQPPRELWTMERAFSEPVKAEEGELLHFTRESFTEFPDVWVSDLEFREPRRVSEANPWQDEYLWGDVELVEWTSSNGAELQGLLYTPENFDPEHEYPLIAYFYERRSDTLHRYQPPTPHRSTIRIPFYTSRGYVVFVPDIPYEEGYPGQSALHAVVSGILHVVERGFVDEDAIGCQGHSWGGYQAAYLVTQTDLFRAAVAGAPVANMTSAYGGVRWGTGRSRMFQYEKTQSRIGGTLWEATQRYLDNSPLFYLDRVQTPLLIMHNDHDGAVPWYQGIELFLGLRRLGKPTWMLNYNDEPHWAVKWPNRRDYAIRMQQFFDHFLKGAAPPKWIAEGVPAVDKGRDLGLGVSPVE